MAGEVAYLLDTDILIGWLQDSHEAIEKITKICESEVPKISVLSIYELAEGAYKARNSGKVLEDTFELIDKFDEILLNREMCIEAGRIASLLKQKGKYIGEGDILIGATAIIQNLTVVTRNIKHFQKIPGLKVEEW